MERLCIYLTYDKQNIVDRYIGYMLKELKTCVSKLIVVCNEKEIVRGKEHLELYADQIYYRENVGLDAGGFKDALCTFLGWNEALSFDELILVNDSFFGPFAKMTEIFANMEKRKIDFWGLSKHAERGSDEIVHCPEHIQSFFLAIKKRMLHSDCFRAYWEELPYFRTFDEAVRNHEMRFTGYFAERGFTYDSLADMSVNDSENIANNYNQYSVISYELIRKRNFPFLKKQQLSYDTLDCQSQENPGLAMKYIENNTDYDVDLIWENLIRTMDISDLQRSLHLQYIISQNSKERLFTSKVLLAVFIQFQESAEYILEYLAPLRYLFDIRIYSNAPAYLKSYDRLGFRCGCVKSADRNLLRELGKWEFVCVIHDADVTGEHEPSCIGKAYLYDVWENLVKNAIHIYGIIECFEEEKRLGFLAPQIPVFGKYFGEIGKCWRDNFTQVKNAAEKMEIRCQMSQNKRPFAISENFWIRGTLIERVLRKSDIAFEELPYLWCYIAQEAGYYSGIVESVDYASVNEVSLQHYLNLIADQIRRQYGDFGDFLGMRKKIFQGALMDFCEKYKNLYLYGTGAMAKKYKSVIPDIEAYIVSDGQPKADKIQGKKVLYLSQVREKEDTGIIVCLDEKNQAQVVSLLKENGWSQFLCI